MEHPNELESMNQMKHKHILNELHLNETQNIFLSFHDKRLEYNF